MDIEYIKNNFDCEYIFDDNKRMEIYLIMNGELEIDKVKIIYENDIPYRTSFHFNNELHRIDEPAVICNNNDIQYYKNGKLHRIDGPADISYVNNKIVNESYYENGKLHRIDGPAIICRHEKTGDIISELYFEYDKNLTHMKMMLNERKRKLKLISSIDDNLQ